MAKWALYDNEDGFKRLDDSGRWRLADENPKGNISCSGFKKRKLLNVILPRKTGLLQAQNPAAKLTFESPDLRSSEFGSERSCIPVVEIERLSPCISSNATLSVPCCVRATTSTRYLRTKASTCRGVPARAAQLQSAAVSWLGAGPLGAWLELLPLAARFAPRSALDPERPWWLEAAVAAAFRQ